MQVLDYFLKDENKAAWGQVCATASQSSPGAYEKLKAYTLEAARLQSIPLTSRVCQADGCQMRDDSGSNVTVKKGETIFINNVSYADESPLEAAITNSFSPFVTDLFPDCSEPRSLHLPNP